MNLDVSNKCYLSNTWNMRNVSGENQPNSIKIEVLDLETNISTTYDSIRAAARALNCQESSIRQYFRNNQKKPYKKRYVFTITKTDS